MKTATIEQVLSWKPCGWDGKHDGRRYTRERITELFDGRTEVTALDIINMDIPDADILWAVLRYAMLSEKTLRIAGCAFAASVLPIFEDLYPGDNRPRVAIETAYRYALGEATEEELKAAAALAARAALAAVGAAALAAGAAEAAVGAAWSAWAAARAAAHAALATLAAAERELQVLLLHDTIMEWEAGNEGRNG